MALKFDRISILVVEDTIPMRKLLVSVLESLGVGKIYTAEHGDAGYTMFQKYNPDIVISDWLMQPSDGMALIRQIRLNPKSPNKLVPIIMITGYSALGRVKEARDMGVTEFLVKPFTANDLAKRIAYVVNRPRDFIETPRYFGPDRRRKNLENYIGPKRRAMDPKDTQSSDTSKRSPDDTWEITSS
jgi:two-component system, chemotaxis family, chemotaxis protein CheY